MIQGDVANTWQRHPGKNGSISPCIIDVIRGETTLMGGRSGQARPAPQMLTGGAGWASPAHPPDAVRVLHPAFIRIRLCCLI